MLRIIFNEESIVAQLRAAETRLADMRPVYQDIGEELVLSHKRRFMAGISPQGTPWAPKSPATIEAYQRRGYTADPRPLIGPSGRLSSEIAYLASQASVEVGSNLVYAEAMQTGVAKGAHGTTSRGAPIPWGNIPARVWLGLSDQDEATIIDIVDEHLEDAFQG